jgi:hypothetical protein
MPTSFQDVLFDQHDNRIPLATVVPTDAKHGVR